MVSRLIRTQWQFNLTGPPGGAREALCFMGHLDAWDWTEGPFMVIMIVIYICMPLYMVVFPCFVFALYICLIYIVVLPGCIFECQDYENHCIVCFFIGLLEACFVLINVGPD